MANHESLLFLYVSSIFVLTLALFCSASNEERQVYIVYMGLLPESEGDYSPSSHHLSLLKDVIEGSSAENFLTRSYTRSFNGFAAKLTDNERQKLASMKEVVSVFPSRTLKLQTTRSWDFMGFDETVIRNATVESDLVIGVLDSGIWPESDSFKDDDFGPAPKKWKGACKGGANFTCNNKVIGARFYVSASARDELGHGSHTASTAAGNTVKGVSFYGLANGIARGAVPSSRIAAYKVCGTNGHCKSEDLLAGFDDAIADGVDIISVSIADLAGINMYHDTIAIGAFHAMAKGVLTSQCAGNSGPLVSSVGSLAPWILTVAASSTDRQIIDKVVLGNGNTIVGRSVNSFTLNGTKFPLIYGKEASSSSQCNESEAQQCMHMCLDEKLVKGKIVLCDQLYGIVEAQRAGALGSILLNDFGDDIAMVLPWPASALNSHDHGVVRSYVNSTKNPEADILKSEAIKDPAAPVLASFSSRGPNYYVPEIMKPDVTAPGVDILAAYSPIASPSNLNLPNDKRRVKYSIISGTSMSCPHAAGVAAYVKTFHPDWSPSAIKSAIMTTAWVMNASQSEDAEFGYGSGHVNPVKAINPGLVYEALKEDYIKMLCSAGYTDQQVQTVSGDNSTCQGISEKASPKDLNYPSMTVRVEPMKSFNIVFNRTVTNVGIANPTYKAEISANPKIDIKVMPEVLSFKSLNEKQSFAVTVSGQGIPDASMESASLTWSDGTHSVRSPIIVHTKLSFA